MPERCGFYRMGDTPSALRDTRCSEPTAHAVRKSYRPPDDQADTLSKSETVAIAAKAFLSWRKLERSSANDITKDKAAITTSWSHGPTEGQITKLKLASVKRAGAPSSTCFRLA
jgi:hypothetical protein